MKKHYKKPRKVMDTEVSIDDIVKHAFANFAYGFSSGIIIIAMLVDSWYFVAGTYLVHKLNESKIFNRNKYTSKFGKRYLYPIPSTIGFTMSYIIGEWFKNYLS